MNDADKIAIVRCVSCKQKIAVIKSANYMKNNDIILTCIECFADELMKDDKE